MVIKTYLTLLIILLSMQPCFGLEISFLPHATVSDISVTIGDVVRFDESTELTKSLNTQVIFKSPQPGDSITLQTHNVRKYVIQKFRLPLTTTWMGPSSIIIKRSGQEISASRLLQVIDDFLQSNKKTLPKAEIRFSAKSLPLPFVLPKGKITFEVVPSSPNIVGSSSLSIIIRIEDRVRKNLSIKGKVQAFAPVAVVSKNVKRGSMLTPSNTQLINKDISVLRNPCFNLREILGKKVTRSFRVGSVINATYVEFPPLVRKGQLVKILINSGSLYISATGIARTNGKLNQVIRVRNASSKKLIFCKVTAPGIVEVQI